MIQFNTMDTATFLSEYWQKKPLLIRQALPDFVNPLSADELAGLSMDEEIESRMVFETPKQSPHWRLKKGPFVASDFEGLPKTHWTLLVQAVDQVIPEVALLLLHFDFLPQWRVDDVMISYAAKHGSVGPHYDNYDVFLYQASGQRKWSLTTKNCNEINRLDGVDLRIMAQFEREEEYILSPGDMLYLPAQVGHHGISLDDECMTYSFGYRSYEGQELWDSLGDYLSEHHLFKALYQDPNWVKLKGPSSIPQEALQSAKQLFQQVLADDTLMQSWFGCFATRLDSEAEQRMPLPLTDEVLGTCSAFMDELKNSEGLLRDGTCRMAYDETTMRLFINGREWQSEGVSPALIQYVADHRVLTLCELSPFLTDRPNQLFLHELWILQWLGAMT